MNHDPSWITLAAFCVTAIALLGTIASTHMRIKRDRKATDVGTCKVIIEGFGTRLAELEVAMARLKDDLAAEKTQHEQTRAILRVALRHIRSIIIWQATDHTAPVPDIPDELLGHI